MTKILVLNRAAVGRTMASAGVRAYHIARVIAEQVPEASVTLTAPSEPDIPSPHPRMKIVPYGSSLSGLWQMLRHDIIIARNFPPHALGVFLHKRLALDFYTSFFFEWMEFARRFPELKQRERWMSANSRYLDLQLTLADYIVCSNQRQRDVCIGALSSLGLITPRTYDQDGTLERLIGVVPYGVQKWDSERAKTPVLKGVVPGIGPDDKVLIWNGSVVEWFDAQLVIRAVGEVAKTRDDVKLYFLGVNHPDEVAGMSAPPVRDAIKLSKELALYGKSVFFNDGWVPYEETAEYLAEADIGVCAGFDNLEARYAQRTRFADLFWAQLPIVCTQGDELAERIDRDPMGVAVPPGDVEAFAAGIHRLVEEDELYATCRANLAVLNAELRWERVLEPLVEYCRNPEGIASSKRRRLLPLVWRTLGYLLAKPFSPDPTAQF